jgi:alkaline phosphatase D
MSLTRRTFLKGSAALLAGFLAPARFPVQARVRFDVDPFTLGVASGYPHATGVTLWTRLAPRPLEGGGLPAVSVPVSWELGADEGFRTVLAQGETLASPQWGHSVHVDVNGLEPARGYFYRFRAGEALSAIGRTRTTPPAGAAARRLRFAFAACQHYEHAYYGAYRHMANEELDFAIHLGDYIYESSSPRNRVREHGTREPVTLEEYRNRYALYKSEAELKAAHHAFPWFVTWDDHEVDNDYANDRSQDLDPREWFLARRAAAYQAYYEHMPLPAWARPSGPDMQLYTGWGFGELAAFSILDTRQYRSHQVCPRPGRGGSNVVREEDCPERLDPALTLLGVKQEQWLHERLGRSQARWNVIAQQTLMAQADRRPGPGADFWTDGWDGYPQARERLLRSVSEQHVSNPIVLSGDVHMGAVTDLKIDFNAREAAVVATEFVCPSIASRGPPQARLELLRFDNPHVKFANGSHRGYCTIEITPRQCVAHLRGLDNALDRESPIRDLAVYHVENARPGARRA